MTDRKKRQIAVNDTQLQHVWLQSNSPREIYDNNVKITEYSFRWCPFQPLSSYLMINKLNMARSLHMANSIEAIVIFNGDKLLICDFYGQFWY